MADKFFVIDYQDGDKVGTRFYRYDNQQGEAEQFCAFIKANGGAVNIRIREVVAPE